MIVSVAGLTDDLSGSFLYDLFRHFGRIERLSYNRQEGTAKILYENLSSAIVALQLNQEEINGSKITVDFDCSSFALPSPKASDRLTEYLRDKRKTFLLHVENFSGEASNENMLGRFRKKVEFMKVFAVRPNNFLIFMEFDAFLSAVDLKEAVADPVITGCFYAPESGIELDGLLSAKDFLSCVPQEQGKLGKLHPVPPSSGIKHQQHPDNKKYSEDVPVSHLYMKK